MASKKEMLTALKASEDAQIAFLQSFVRAASPNPPGDTKEAASIITDYLKSNQVPFQYISPLPHAPNVVSEFVGGAGSGPRVVLNGHIDVFPVGPDRDGWLRDPWSGDIDENGRIHGRGVVDMKAGTAALIIAYVQLYQRRQHLRGSVALCAVSDEETGGRWGTKHLITEDKAKWGGDVMLSAEPAGCGSVRFSEKGTLRMTGTLRTRGAHGAYLNLSKGAIRTAVGFLSEVVEKVEALPTDMPREIRDQLDRAAVRERIDGIMGKGTAAIITRPTVNIGTIKGGVKVNMIPDSCVFELDIRLPIGLVRDTVLEVIDCIKEQYKDARVEIEVHEAASNPSSFSELNHPMLGLLIKNAETIDPDQPVPLAIPSMGATDCKHYRYAGIPAYVYGCSPLTNERLIVCKAETDPVSMQWPPSMSRLRLQISFM